LSLLVPILKEWIKKGNYINMLVLTIKDGESLEERLGFLEASWRRLYHENKELRKKWKKVFPGGLKSIEIKLGKNSKQWHPHIHCLLMKDTYSKDFEWLKDEWKKATDGQGSVYIQALNRFNLLKSAVECVKYIMKPEKGVYEDDIRFNELYVAVKGKRQINTWGLLRGLKEKDIDEAAEGMDEKKLEAFVCSQCGCSEGELKSYYYSDLVGQAVYDIKAFQH
jgi:hypothetical protein